MLSPPLLAEDLAYFEANVQRLLPHLRGRRILLTGGTGFFGKWLVECILSLSRREALDLRLSLLTRNIHAFHENAPQLAAAPELSLMEGDVRTFPFHSGRFDLLIHAAGESVVPPETPFAEQLSSIAEGTRHVLDLAVQAGAERLLFVSSGAVYGPQPRTVLHVAEDDPQQPDASAYTVGKRAGEALCLGSGVPCVIARPFAFLGAHLPMDAHFAAGNFLRDALAGQPILIRGDGTPLRSYMYAADLAVWLWTLLLEGMPGRAYNVGSDIPVSIRELAERTAAVVHPGLPIEVRQPPAQAGQPPRYVPSTERAQSELGLRSGITLEEGIRRTARWHRLAR